MHLPQIKVPDMKTVINVPILLSTKEFPILSEYNSFKATGEVFKSAGENSAYNLAPIHAWVNIDQLQGEMNAATRLGFGMYESDLDKKNGLYYTMKLDEKGEGRHVSGTITYTIVAVMVKGKKYAVKKDHKLPNGTTIQTKFEFSYNGKSAKNSTLFKLLRKLIANGLLQFEKTTHLELLGKVDKEKKDEKPASVDIPQAPKGKRRNKSASAEESKAVNA